MPSYSDIAQRLFGASYSTGLRLGGNEYTKPIAVSENWTRLRLGMLVTIVDIGALIPSASIIGGFCSNGRAYYTSNAAFAGWSVSRAASGGDFAYTANSGNPYYSTTNFDGVIRVGLTNTSTTVGSSTHYFPASPAGNPRCGILVIDVIKGATSFTIGAFTGAIGHMSLNLGMPDLYNVIEQVAQTPVIRGTSVSMLPYQTTGLPYNEQTNGYLNCFSLYWSRLAYPLEIYGLAVYELY